MKLYKRVVFSSPSLPPQPIPFRFLCQPVRKALRDLRIVKAAAGGGIWFAAGVREIRTLTSQGVSRAHIWTIRELEGLPWAERPLTLGCCLRAWRNEASGLPEGSEQMDRHA